MSIGPVGSAQARLMRQRAAVDFAVGWMTTHRRPAAEALSYIKFGDSTFG